MDMEIWATAAMAATVALLMIKKFKNLGGGNTAAKDMDIWVIAKVVTDVLPMIKNWKNLEGEDTVGMEVWATARVVTAAHPSIKIWKNLEGENIAVTVMEDISIYVT